MNELTRQIHALRAGIARALPNRIVTDNLIDHPQRRRDELLKGVITVLLERVGVEDWLQTAYLFITAQLEVQKPEDIDTHGGLIEAAELELFNELTRYLRNTLNLPTVRIREPAQFSAQSKVPYGWFVLRVEYGPLSEACTDDTEAYPPNLHITPLSGVHVDIDAEPHETRTEHKKWLGRDYSSTQPELTADMELNNGNTQP